MTSDNESIFQSDFKVTSQKKGVRLTKFIHASDIHLGSHQYRNEDRANDFICAFEEILTTAITHQVDFILLGGDVFTSLDMLPGKLTRVVKLLNDFKNETNNKILSSHFFCPNHFQYKRIYIITSRPRKGEQ